MQQFLCPSGLVRRAEIAVKLRWEPTAMMWETLHPSLASQRRVRVRVSTWSWAECFAESIALCQLLYQRLAGPFGTCRARHNSPVAAAAAFHALPKASTAPPGSGDLQSSSTKPRHCKRNATISHLLFTEVTNTYKYIQILSRLKTELWFSFKQFQTVRFQHGKKQF